MPKLVVGQPAPLFCLPDLDGHMVRLDDFLDRTVLVNFWSAECPHVGRVDYFLAAWQERIVLLNIACNASEPPDLLRAAAVRRGLQWVLMDPKQHVADLYGAEITPQLFLIDAGGFLRYQGAFDDVTFRQREPTRTYISEALQALLIGDPLPVVETSPYGCSIVRDFTG